MRNSPPPGTIHPTFGILYLSSSEHQLKFVFLKFQLKLCCVHPSSTNWAILTNSSPNILLELSSSIIKFLLFLQSVLVKDLSCSLLDVLHCSRAWMCHAQNQTSSSRGTLFSQDTLDLETKTTSRDSFTGLLYLTDKKTIFFSQFTEWSLLIYLKFIKTLKCYIREHLYSNYTLPSVFMKSSF